MEFKVKQIQKRHLEQIEGLWQLGRIEFDAICSGAIKRPFWYHDKDYGQVLVLEFPDGELKRLFLRNHSAIVRDLKAKVPQMFV